jgi:signal transduction histidine kinase
MATAHPNWHPDRSPERLAALLARLSVHAIEDAPESIEALERCAAETRLIATRTDDAGDRSSLELVSQLLSEVAAIAERMRRRLARFALDLHDGALQEVAALRLQVHALRSGLRAAADPPRDVAAFADEVGERLRKLERELRELVDSFERPSLVEGKFEQVVRDYVRGYSRDTGITSTVSLSGDPSLLTSSQRIALFRVLAEALTNVGRHAHADRVSVSLRVQKKQARLRVRDNGKGFDSQRTSARAARRGLIGLAGMAERVRLLGGALDIASQPGGPTTITAVVPAGPVGDPPPPKAAPRSRRRAAPRPRKPPRTVRKM